MSIMGMNQKSTDFISMWSSLPSKMDVEKSPGDNLFYSICSQDKFMSIICGMHIAYTNTYSLLSMIILLYLPNTTEVSQVENIMEFGWCWKHFNFDFLP